MPLAEVPVGIPQGHKPFLKLCLDFYRWECFRDTDGVFVFQRLAVGSVLVKSCQVPSGPLSAHWAPLAAKAETRKWLSWS